MCACMSALLSRVEWWVRIAAADWRKSTWAPQRMSSPSMHHCTAHHPRLTDSYLVLQTYETVVDGGCEQEHEFEIVRCTGHQHIGSRCITLYNADNGDRICQSCPVYGTEPGLRLLPHRRYENEASSRAALPCTVHLTMYSAACRGSTCHVIGRPRRPS